MKVAFQMILISCILAILSPGALVQGAPERATIRTGSVESPVTRYAQEKRALVLELLRVTNAKEQVNQVIDTMIETLPYELRDVFREILDADEMLAKMVPIYEKYLSAEDLRAIIEFCKTPAGTHWVAAQPKITKDAMIVMKVHTQEKLAEYLKNSKAH